MISPLKKLFHTAILILICSSYAYPQARATCSPVADGVSWHLPASWDCGFVPRTNGWPYDLVVIDQDVTITSDINISGCCNPQRSNVRVNTGSTLTITGAVFSTSGAANGGRIDVRNGGKIISDNLIRLEANRVSRIRSGGEIEAAVFSVTSDGRLDHDGKITASDSVDFSSTQAITLDGDIDAVNAITVSGGGSISGSADMNGSEINFTGNVTATLSGNLTATNDFVVANSSNVTTTGTVTATDLYNTGSVAYKMNGTANVTNVFNTGSSDLQVGGTLNASGTVNNNGAAIISGGGIMNWSTYSCTGSAYFSCDNSKKCNDADPLPGAGTSGINLGSCTPLSATIYGFRGKMIDSKVHLDWSSLLEINNDYFVIEASQNLREFEEVGRVYSLSNNSHETIDYEFETHLGRTEGLYFRLKDVNFNGVEKLHNIIYVALEHDHETYIFPNPSPFGNFVLRAHENFKNCSLTVLDQTSTVIDQVTIPDGGEVFEYSGDLNDGFYLIEFVSPKEKKVFKLQVH